MEKYNIGDIVFVSEYNYDDGTKGLNHLFVIIDKNNLLVPIEYFGFIISSHIEKDKNNSKFKYNEFLSKNNINKLKKNSIVKCDQIYRIAPSKILFKIGNVTIDDYIRFIETYALYDKNENLAT